MSVLRKARDKAKEKAREGFRAINTERKKHFGANASSNSRVRGAGHAPAQPSSYHFRQMKETNDAFQAILDDESDLFSSMESDLKPVPTTSSSNHVNSVGATSKSQSFDNDLFDDDSFDGHESRPINSLVDSLSDPLTDSLSDTPSSDPLSDSFTSPSSDPPSNHLSNTHTGPPNGPISDPPTDIFSDLPSSLLADHPPSDPLFDPLTEPLPDPLTNPLSDPLTEPLPDPPTNPLSDPHTDPLSAALEEEETDSIPVSDVTHQQRSPSPPAPLKTPDRAPVSGETEESETLSVSEPWSTVSVDTAENQDSVTQEASKEGNLEQETDTPTHSNPTIEAMDQSVVESVLESDPNNAQEEPGFEPVGDSQPGTVPVDGSDTMGSSSVGDLFSDTFTTVVQPPTTEHTIAPSTSTIHPPVTPLSSSFEDDNHLSPSVISPDKSTCESRGVSSERSDDELISNTALLEELLSDSPKSNIGTQPPRRVSPVTHESKHLDSGIFDNESHRRSLSADFVEVTEDRYSRKGIKGTSFTSPSVSPHKPTVKRNSAGLLPPTRPPISPNVRRRLSEKTAKKERVPADDLFGNDFVEVPYPSQSKPTVPARPSTTKISNRPLPTPNPQAVKQEPLESIQTKPLVKQDAQLKRREHMLDEPDLTLPYHLILALIMYLYFSLNPWSYLAGFLAGFLTVYLLVGTVFVWYVVTQERERKEKKRVKMGPSNNFLQRMNTNFEDIRNYESTKFMAVLKYNHNTHHPRKRMKAHVMLENDFFLHVKIFPEGPNEVPFGWREDLRLCTVTHAPEDIITQRKRRWNKKFPIHVSRDSNKLCRVFLFCPTSRDKEDWFRRLRHAAEGGTSEQLIGHLTDFFGYMEGYFPKSSSGPRERKSHSHPVSRAKKQLANKGNVIQYSRDKEDSLLEEDRGSVSITRETGPVVSRHSRLHTPPPQTGTSVDREKPTEEIASVPKSLPSDIVWLNAIAARMCWDIWHDERWKDWVMSRIQKKLAKIKKPSFIDDLILTDVDVGNDMPKVNRLSGGPRLDLKGMWVYLDVTYEGCFVMTIKTRLKLGKEKKEEGEQGKQMSVLKSKGSGLLASNPHTKHSSTGSGLSHSNAAKALGSSVDPYDDEIDSGSSDEETPTLGQSIVEELNLPQEEEPQEEESHTRSDRLKSAVKRIGKRVAKSGIVQRAANSGIVKRAIVKMSSYPLVLTVVVNRLDGQLAVNVPPPRTDTIWFAFVNSPHLELTAKPKLGQREVKLSAITQWIEKKLREVVNKKLVLPEMEDLTVKILNSGLPEDTQKVLVNDDKK